MSVDVWAALAALLVAAVLVMVGTLANVPAEVHGGFTGAATMLVTFAAGALARARATRPLKGDGEDELP